MTHEMYLHVTVKMGVLRFKVFVLICHTVQWHIMNPSESTLLSQICIDSLPGFWMSVMLLRIKNVPIHERVCVIPQTYYLD